MKCGWQSIDQLKCLAPKTRVEKVCAHWKQGRCSLSYEKPLFDIGWHLLPLDVQPRSKKGWC